MPILPRAQPLDVLMQRHGERFRWLVLFVVGVASAAGVLSTSSFNVAVPALTRHFGLGQDQVQWVVTGFMTAMTVGMLPTSWLIDRWGFRRVFQSAVLLLAASSLAGFVAPAFPLVVAARIVQGAAAGVLQPMAVLALMRLFPAGSQGRAAGVMTLSIALVPAVAPALGGALLDHFGWRSIFLLNLPFCLVAGWAGLYLLPLPTRIERRPFDWTGAALLAVATIALVETVSSLQHSGPSSPWTIGQFALAISAVLLFVRHARRSAAPIISVGLFAQRTFALGSVVAFAYGFGLFASTYLIPVFLQNALAYPAASAGMALVPSGIALVLTLPVAGRMADRHSPKWVTALGLAMFGVSFLVFAVRGGAIQYAELIGATVLGRIGLGLILPALNLATLHHLAPHQLGQSSVVVSYARQLGGVMGVAIAAVFIEWRESIHGRVAPGIFTAYAQGFMLLAGVFALALVAACFMQTRRGDGQSGAA